MASKSFLQEIFIPSNACRSEQMTTSRGVIPLSQRWIKQLLVATHKAEWNFRGGVNSQVGSKSDKMEFNQSKTVSQGEFISFSSSNCYRPYTKCLNVAIDNTGSLFPLQITKANICQQQLGMRWMKRFWNYMRNVLEILVIFRTYLRESASFLKPDTRSHTRAHEIEGTMNEIPTQWS